MRNLRSTMIGLAFGAVTFSEAAVAQTLPITGTRENVTPLSPPGGRCVPPYANTVNIAPGNVSSTGTSNISTFTSTQSHCILMMPPTPFTDGIFTYTFEGGDTIFGTYSGVVAAGATAGTFTATENLIITGGTGRFVGASGTIDTNGSLIFGNGVSTFQGTLTGGITATTATASGTFATAVGSPSAATGNYASAFGAFALASGNRSTALGTFAEATNTSAVAVGDNSFASGDRSVAIGVNARATNNLAVALGNVALASGLNATAIGNASQATGIGSSALGNGAAASALGSVAVGVLTTASATNATAVGARAAATFAGSTAIGANAATTADNQVALGGAGSAVRVGDIASSTAAQQASSVGIATVDGNGVLGRNTTLLPALASQGAAIGALQADQVTLFDLVDRNRADIRESNEGVAMALALDTPAIPAGASVAVSGGIGYFKNRTALATAISVAVGQMSSVSAGFGYGFKSKEVGARAGFQLAW